MSDLLERISQGFEALAVQADTRRAALEALERWLTEPALQEYRGVLEGLADRGSFNELLDAFRRTLPFGTGGRRGPVGVGPNRFNAWTLSTSVQGHADMLRERTGGHAHAVVAFDVRVFRDLRGVFDPERLGPLDGLSSAALARTAACVYAARGVTVSMPDPDADPGRDGGGGGPRFLATPELSLAIRRLGADGGLNVSASHNHPDDNGSKVYNRHGAQDVPPDDEALSLRVEGITEAETMSWTDAREAGLVRLLDDAVPRAFVALNRTLSVTSRWRAGRVAFTNLHGCGISTVVPVLREEGFDVVTVPEQASLDGAFPTVAFRAPNPENPSAFECVRAVAEAEGADLTLATDPDADRIGAEVRLADGRWRFLTGHELLALVTDWILGWGTLAGRLPEDAFALTTIPSTRLVGDLARGYGIAVEDDLLVGLKWVAQVLASLEQTGRWRGRELAASSLMFAGEEAHGMLLTSELRDKDAAGPALLLAEMAACGRAHGWTLEDRLVDIARRVGACADIQVATVMTGASGVQRMAAIQAAWRREPPESLGGRRVLHARDLLDRGDWRGEPVCGTDATARVMLVFSVEGGARVVMRPSGTEPKNKLYVQVAGPRAPDGTARAWTTGYPDWFAPGLLAAEKSGVCPSGPLGQEATEADLARCAREAGQLGQDVQQAMLECVGIRLGDVGRATSAMLAVECRLEFAERVAPGLARHASSDAALDSYLYEALAGFGPEPRKLVAGGVERWLDTAGLDGERQARVRQAFGLPVSRSRVP